MRCVLCSEAWPYCYQIGASDKPKYKFNFFIFQVFSGSVQLISFAKSEGQSGPLCWISHPHWCTEEGQQNVASCVLNNIAQMLI